jgi:hypothetical protein
MYIVKYTISVALQEYKLTVARPTLVNLAIKTPAGFEASSVITYEKQWMFARKYLLQRSKKTKVVSSVKYCCLYSNKRASCKTYTISREF